MGESNLPPMTLDDVFSFNEALVSISKTGLPLGFLSDESPQTLSDKLTRVNASLALHVGRGQLLDAALNEVPELTAQYRNALQTWHRCDRSTDALDAMTRPAIGRQQIDNDLNYSLLQPVILAALVYFGLTYLVLVDVPKLQSLHEQMRQMPGTVTQWMIAARGAYPFWGPIVPLVFVIVIVTWRLCSTEQRLAWLPRRRHALTAIYKANYATSLANLIDQNYSLADSLEILGPISKEESEVSVRTSAGSVVMTGQRNRTDQQHEAGVQQETVAVHDPALQVLPPLLRWALTSGLSGRPLANALHFAARTYTQTANARLAQYRVWLPVLFGALLGGLIVLLYGLSLFVPLAELLWQLTKP